MRALSILLPLLLIASADAQTFVQASAFDTSSFTTSDVTPAKTTTAGNALVCFTRSNKSCQNNYVTGTSWGLTDTGGDLFTPVVPTVNGVVVGVNMTTVGTGYFATPTVTVSGCSTNGTAAAATSGTTPNITVGGVSFSVIPSGCSSGLPTIAFSGGTPITGNAAVAVVSMMAVEATECAAAFVAYNIAGTASNQVTFTHVTSDYHGLSCQEWNLGTTTNPLDVVAQAVSTAAVSSLTTNSFSTSQAKEVAILGTTIQNTSNTWTAATGYTIPTGASSTGTSGGLVTTQYKIFTTTQSGITAVSPAANHTGAMSVILVTLKAAGASTSKMPPVVLGSLWSPGMRTPAIWSPSVAWALISAKGK